MKKEISWRHFKGLKQLNEFLESPEHLDKAGINAYVNGRPDHIINVQILPDNRIIVFYWTKENDYKEVVK